jgi:hypothetical protein
MMMMMIIIIIIIIKGENIKMILQVMGGAWTGLIWLRIGTGGGRLWMG